MALRGNGQLLIHVKGQPLNNLLRTDSPIAITGYTLEPLSTALQARPTFSAAVTADHWLLAKPISAQKLRGTVSPEGPTLDQTPWDTAHTAAASLGYAHYVEPDLLHERIANLASQATVGLDTDWPPQVSDTDGIAPDWHLTSNFGSFEGQRPQTTGAGIRIAHLDTGYTPGHRSVPRNLNATLAYDFWDNKPGAVDPGEQFLGVLNPGHGTATLALLAGNTMALTFGTYSFQGDIGGAPDAEVIPVRISPSVVHLYTSTMAQGLLYALAPNPPGAAARSPERPCDVITISHGGLPSAAWADAVNKLYEAGIVVVAASGDNYNVGPVDLFSHYTVYPSAFNRVITALGATYAKTPYILDKSTVMQGCWGPDSVMEKAIAAYTPNVVWMKYDLLPDGFDMNGAGTSASTPQIAAACAVWLQRYGAQLPSDWRRVEACRLALFDGADRPQPDRSELGWGTLNVARSLDPSVAGPVLAKAQTAAQQPGLLPSAEDSVSSPFWRVLMGSAPPQSEQERMYETEVEQLTRSSTNLQLRAGAALVASGGPLTLADQVKYRALLSAESLSAALRQRINQVPTAATMLKSAIPPQGEPMATRRAIFGDKGLPAYQGGEMKQYKWGLQTIALFAVLAIIALWISDSVATATPKAPRLQAQWLCVVGILIGFCMAAGYIVNRRIDGILIDERYRVSLSRLQWVVWFVVLVSAFFVGAMLNLAAGSGHPFPTMQTDLFALIGLASGSAVVSNLVVDSKKSSRAVANVPPRLNVPGNIGSIDLNADPSEASWRDLYCGEEVTNRDIVDVSRLQQLLTTTILVYAYVVFIWRDLADAAAAGQFAAMPSVDQSFLGLLAASHAGYLAYKATPKT